MCYRVLPERANGARCNCPRLIVRAGCACKHVRAGVSCTLRVRVVDAHVAFSLSLRHSLLVVRQVCHLSVCQSVCLYACSARSGQAARRR